MADKSKIEWTDATWNPVRGCSRVSEGCRNCYAEVVANRFKGEGQPYEGLLAKGGQWNGSIKLVQSALETPFRWQRPRRVFVNSTSDLFHEGIPDWYIDRVFAVMALCPQHTFQILTKRPERMTQYCRTLGEHHERDRVSHEAKAMKANKGFFYTLGKNGWHLPNVWLGTSIEDQATVNERIPQLLRTPAAVRFVSAEPLLDLVELDNIEHAPGEFINCLSLEDWAGLEDAPEVRNSPGGGALIDWVICGGESGTNARPMHPDWARSLRNQCTAYQVPFFFKQWGEWAPIDEWQPSQRAPKQIAIRVNGSEVPHDVAPQDVGGQRFAKVGKRRAGRTLDARTWDEYPKASQ